MKNLLEKVKILDYKYQMINVKDEFNLFTVLRKFDDEVNLHSRIIYELLNPKGTHGLNTKLLELFLKTINQGENDDLKKVKVSHEKYIGQINKEKTRGGQIDLLIEDIGEKHIVIENKIHAEDQENQLLRYSNYKENGIIYYLTLRGDSPSEKSLGTLKEEDIICISYRDEIREWIDLCIEKTSLMPELREALKQYKNLINILIGDTSSMEERIELIHLLSENNNILAAAKIANNWVHVRWHTEYDFWTELEEHIMSKSEFEILNFKKFSSDKVSSNIHKSRNKNPYFGLTLKLL